MEVPEENLPDRHFVYQKIRIEDLQMKRAFDVIILVVTNSIGRKKQLQWYTVTFKKKLKIDIGNSEARIDRKKHKSY